jgi:hypothetical protein
LVTTLTKRKLTLAHKPAPVLATYLFFALGVVVPLLITIVGEHQYDVYTQLAVTATLVLAAGRYAWLVGSRERHLFEMTLWLFVYFWLGVAPLLQMRIRWPGTTGNIAAQFLPEASGVVLVGVICLVLGSTLAYRNGPPRSGQVTEVVEQSLNEGRVILLAFGALGLAAVFVAMVGPGSLFASRTDISAASSATFGSDPTGTILRAGTNMGLLVAFVALMHVNRLRKIAGRKLTYVLPTVVLVALLVIVNPLSSARYTFGTVFLAVLAALGGYATLRRFRTVAIGAVLGIVVLFPVLDTFRRSLEARITFTGPLESLITGDFDGFAQIVNTVEYVHTLGITWGNQIVGVIFFWVPRNWWPSKPIDTGGMIAEFKGYAFTNLSSPLWSEFFVNFGWVGVTVGMFLVGFVFRRLDMRSERQLQLSSLPTILGCVLPFYMLIVLRGSLLQTTANLAVILLATWFVSTRKKAAVPAPRPRVST